MKQRFQSVLCLLGAMIGAGFVSGREVVAFFTRYGINSWWLIGLSVLTMALLCSLCLNASKSSAELPTHHECFSSRQQIFFRFILTSVLFLIAGSMTAAAGNIFALLIPFRYAYVAGVLGTLCFAWLLSNGNMKPYAWISVLLTGIFAAFLIWALTKPTEKNVVVASIFVEKKMFPAAISAVGYSSMNIAVSIGIICRSRGESQRENNGLSLLMGISFGVLLFMSNLLYIRCPESWESTFPILGFLEEGGTGGYLFCVALLYFAILTSLVALVYTLKCDMKMAGLRGGVLAGLILGIPFVVSLIGFAGIVEYLYAPSGILCLVFVFLPMIQKQFRKDY